MIDHPTLSALRHFFSNPEHHEAGACVVNALLTQIEAAGRRPRLTHDDFARLSELFALLHIPGPLDAPPELVRAVSPAARIAPDVLREIAERTREKAANGPRNDPNHLPEAGMLTKAGPPPR
jgi:hypothetical protein